MSETNPTYSKNPVASFFEHIGHEAHEVASFVADRSIGILKASIEVRAELRAQLPTLIAETTAVVGDVLALKSLGLAVANAAAAGGENPAADLGVLAALAANWPGIVHLFSDTGTLVGTLGKDIKADAKAL